MQSIFNFDCSSILEKIIFKCLTFVKDATIDVTARMFNGCGGVRVEGGRVGVKGEKGYWFSYIVVCFLLQILKL